MVIRKNRRGCVSSDKKAAVVSKDRSVLRLKSLLRQDGNSAEHDGFIQYETHKMLRRARFECRKWTVSEKPLSANVFIRRDSIY